MFVKHHHLLICVYRAFNVVVSKGSTVASMKCRALIRYDHSVQAPHSACSARTGTSPMDMIFSEMNAVPIIARYLILFSLSTALYLSVDYLIILEFLVTLCGVYPQPIGTSLMYIY